MDLCQVPNALREISILLSCLNDTKEGRGIIMGRECMETGKEGEGREARAEKQEEEVREKGKRGKDI